MLSHDTLNRVETQPGAFADTLGREEGLKDV
jgi:hypothetical protein